jgi:hypothetical protein
MALEILFKAMLDAATKLRKSSKHADGLAFWNKYKGELSKHDSIKVDWCVKGPGKKELDKIMSLAEYEIDGHGKQHTNEFNHFYIQTVRLPRSEAPNIRKVIQVGLNIGQYLGCGGTKKKWMTINNYLSKKEIKRINSEHGEMLIALTKTLFPKL